MRILVTGAGGFIGGWLTRHFVEAGHEVVGVDIKELKHWYQHSAYFEVVADLRDFHECERILRARFDEVYNLAADMGGMGFIEKHRVECLRSVLINTNLLEASSVFGGVQRYFFSSSACVYPTTLQEETECAGLKEKDAYPAMAERGYGWEKLFSEMLCQEYWHECGLETHIARFHNVMGPHETWHGGREKAPAAICRKVIDAKLNGQNEIEIWGDGTRTRSFMWIEDCITGIDKIMHSPELIATPINLGTTEAVSINELVTMVEEIARIKLKRRYMLDAPLGVVGRNSDNTMIRDVLGWEPKTPLREGLEKTYRWIESEILRRDRQNQTSGW